MLYSTKQLAHLDSHDHGFKNTTDSTKREEDQQGPLQDPMLRYKYIQNQTTVALVDTDSSISTVLTDFLLQVLNQNQSEQKQYVKHCRCLLKPSKKTARIF